MNSSLWTVVVLSCLVGSSWSQRPRDRANPPRHQQQKQQPAAEEGDLTDECPEPNGYFADGYQCDKYYECKDGAITEKLCPDGMVFNDFSILHEKCDLPFNLDCSQRSLLQDPKPSTHCPRQNGYFAHEDEKICDKFYFCVDGKFNMITCPSGLVYNQKTGICTWPDEAKKKHCSSQASESNRVKRVAFWKSDEESSSSKETSAEEPGSFYDSGSVEGGRKRKTGSAEYGSGSAEYGDYAASASAEYADDYPTYDGDVGLDDPEFSNFDAEFQDFADGGGAGGLGGFPGFGPHDFIRRKKDSVGRLDGYVKGDVKTVGTEPQKAAMGMDSKYYERLAEEVVEKEMEEEESRKGETNPGNRTTQNSSFRLGNSPHASRVGKPVNKSPSARAPTIRRPRTEVFNFECPKVGEKKGQEHPRYPDPEDCQFFYVCINGDVPRRNGCKIGQVFNEATGSCDWPRNVPECKDWYKGILTDEELEALEHPKPKVRNSNYTSAAQKRKRPHQSVQYDLPN